MVRDFPGRHHQWTPQPAIFNIHFGTSFAQERQYRVTFPGYKMQEPFAYHSHPY
jgi:hypothetical protein